MALTQKQKAALARAPKSRRAAMLKGFRGQSNGSNGSNGSALAVRRSTADRVLASGVGHAVGAPFGKSARGRLTDGWNAFHPYHLPLPRAVGPYSVVRTSILHSTSAKYIQLGAYERTTSDKWSNIIGVESITAGTAINAGANARNIAVPAPAADPGLAGSTFSCVPAAISVQIMSPGPLQTASGQVAMAVCPTQLDLNNRQETWNDLSTEIVSYMRPRMCAAAKLALRGVQMDSYPLNMNALSDFRRVEHSVSGGDFPLNDTGARPVGLAPLVIINENNANLNLLIAVEWRVRFDIGNAAVATHQHHGVTPDAVWNRCVQTAMSLGNGVRDIADVTASIGQALGSMRALGSASMPMLVD